MPAKNPKYPFVKPVVKNGKKQWVADLRSFGKGRTFHATKELADHKCKDHFSGTSISGAERNEYLHLRDRLQKAGATFSQAVNFLLKHRPSSNMPLSSALQICINNKRDTKKTAKYLKLLEASVQSFIDVTGDRKCSEVTGTMIHEWLHGVPDGKWKPKWAPRTKKGKLIDLRAFLSFCRKRGWIALDPAKDVEAIAVEDKPPGILTVEQCRKLLTAAKDTREQMVPYIVLGLFCGIRPEEILHTTWSHVHLDSKFVEVTARVSKTRKRRLVTLPDNAVHWLKLGGQLPPLKVRKKMAVIRTAANISKWPHDALRHTFASMHLAKYQDPNKTAHELGHWNTDMLYRHYRELVKPSEAEKFWQIQP